MTPARRFIIGRALVWAAAVDICIAVPTLVIGAVISSTTAINFAYWLAGAGILFFLCGYLLLGEDGR